MISLRLETLEDRTTPSTLPSGFTESTLVSGLSSPTSLVVVPDGRLLVTQQGGALRVVENGQLLATPAISLSVNAGGERGLLGVAVDPNFASNGFVYLYATQTTGNVHRVSRFTMTGNTLSPASEVVLLTIPDSPGTSNHNGGALHFGTDGKLYIAVGDDALPSNSQTLNNLSGKILRINPDGSIPADNPFFSTATGNNRAIWALGLRNPFTFAISPETGQMFINDVGQNSFEEVNLGTAGANYGWPGTEGNFNPSSFPTFTNPTFAYPHASGTAGGFAIAGGVFYPQAGGGFPAEYAGDYFFADFVNDWIRHLDPVTGQVNLFASNLPGGIVDLDVQGGALLVLSRDGGQITRIRFPAGEAPPMITQPPASQTVSLGQNATFSVSVEGSPPLAFQWQRNGANIPGANGSSYTLTNSTLADNGATFRVVVTNPFGTATSNAATLTVLNNDVPVPTISSPTPGTLFRGGQTFDFAGSASDPEDGPLPASALSWRVDYITNNEVRPFIPETPGVLSGSFTIPTVTPYTRTDVLYRITLTATDSMGATATTTVDLLPRIAVLDFRSVPSGLTLTLDGQPFTTPALIESVAGLDRELAALPTQPLGNSTYQFAGWSDGGPISRTIRVPDEGLSLTANYGLLVGPPVVPPPVSPPVVTPPPIVPSLPNARLTITDSSGQAQLASFDVFGNLQLQGEAFRPFPGVPGLVRGAASDIDGDGIADAAYVTGPGGGALLRIVNGLGTEMLAATDLFPSEDLSGIGLFVALGDIDGDGRAEIAVSADLGGGPRVRLFRWAGGQLTQLQDFFAIEDLNFRGGARIALGDINGDGRADLLVSAGFGGGPRIALFDGVTLASGTPGKLLSDFFAFEVGLRDGAFIAAGNLLGDRAAELLIGAGPGGGPRVLVLSLADLQAGQTRPLANFFAFDPGQRGGVRLTAKDGDNDGRFDLLVASGDGQAGQVRMYRGSSFTGDGGVPTGEPQSLDVLGSGIASRGIFVG